MKRRQQPDGVGAAADAGDGHVRQAPLHGEQLRGGLVADDALEVAHQRRVRMRPDRGAEHVVGGGHVRDPVAHRLVDRVLERGAPRVDLAHLGAERAHAQHVGRLALDVLGAHVDDALQVQQRAGGGGGHAVLAGAGLGDHARLAEPPRQQGLAERVVDLVRAGVGQVLALQVEAQAAGVAAGAALQLRRQPVSAVQRCWPADVAAAQLPQLRPEVRLLADLQVGGLQVQERGDQRLRHEAAAELALAPPSTAGVGLDQGMVDPLGPGFDGRAIDTGASGTLDEEGDAVRDPLAGGRYGADAAPRRRPRRRRPRARRGGRRPRWPGSGRRPA